jgi:hypothetical protein
VHFDKARGQWVVAVDRMINEVRHRKCKRLPKGTTESEARSIEERMHVDMRHALKTGRDNEWESYVAELLDKTSWIDETLARCFYRAKIKKMLLTITKPQIARALLVSNGRCQITGIKFCTNAVPGQTYRPFMHSIDRINSKEGYTQANIRIVCSGVNMAMMHWGEQLFSQFAVGYVLHKYGFMGDIAGPKSAFNMPNRSNLEC